MAKGASLKTKKTAADLKARSNNAKVQKTAPSGSASSGGSFAPESHPFIKKLAANDRPTRDKALEALGKFLQTPKAIPELELLKLWRGLFYSMWFSDRPRTQQKLAFDLADLVSKLKLVNVFPFLDAFWVIMAREWEDLDQHRLDKFLMLLRRYVYAGFRRLKAEGWDRELVADYIKVAEHVPLNPSDHKVSNGIRLHVFDVYLDEISRLMREDVPEGTEEEDIDWKELMEDVPVQELLKPIEAVAKTASLKFLRERAQEVLEDERLVQWGVVEEKVDEAEADKKEEEEESEDEWGGFD